MSHCKRTNDAPVGEPKLFDSEKEAKEECGRIKKDLDIECAPFKDFDTNKYALAIRARGGASSMWMDGRCEDGDIYPASQFDNREEASKMASELIKIGVLAGLRENKATGKWIVFYIGKK